MAGVILAKNRSAVAREMRSARRSSSSQDGSSREVSVGKNLLMVRVVLRSIAACCSGS